MEAAMNQHVAQNAKDRFRDFDHPHIARTRTLTTHDWRYHLERSNGIEGEIWEVSELSEEGRKAQAREGAAGILLSVLFFFG
jgi:hypothetical protein